MKKGITMDSGAGNNVMPRRMVMKKSEIRESEGSRRGVHYVAANDGRVPNEMEYDIKFGEYDSQDLYYDSSGRRWVRTDTIKAQRKRYKYTTLRDMLIVLRDKDDDGGQGYPKYTGCSREDIHWVTMNGNWVGQK